MEIYKMGVVEEKFAELVWEHGAIPSGELVQLAGEHLEWKKSTTYTVIKKLCNKGILKSEGGIVSAALSREQYLARDPCQDFWRHLPGKRHWGTRRLRRSGI